MDKNYLLEWDKSSEHFYETGINQCVLYPYNSTAKAYKPGVAWNGISAISESPSGAEANAIWADNIKYLNLYSAEEFAASIEAYMYPDEFAILDGSASPYAGLYVGQQDRGTFGLCYRTTVGNDTEGNALGYKLHMIYGCKASPSEKSYQTINDSPEAITFNWEISTIPVNVEGFKPTSVFTIDSTKLDAAGLTVLASLEQILYGTPAVEGDVPVPEVPARLPLPDEIIAMFAPDDDED